MTKHDELRKARMKILELISSKAISEDYEEALYVSITCIDIVEDFYKATEKSEE